MTEPKKFYVRFSEIADHAKIMEFYAENPHDNVAGRHSDLIKSLADNGSVILIEDAETNKIVGASIAYPLLVKNGDVEQQKYLEVGTTRMVLNGYAGLFDIMIGLQVMRSYLVEPPEERFVCQMESPAVQKMAYRFGFRPFVPSEELVAISDKTLDIDPGTSYGYDNWYTGGIEVLPVLAKLVRDAVDKPYLENKAGDKIKLDFSKSKFLTMFEDEIRALADNKSFKGPDNEDYTRNIANHRQDFMRRFFK